MSEAATHDGKPTFRKPPLSMADRRLLTFQAIRNLALYYIRDGDHDPTSIIVKLHEHNDRYGKVLNEAEIESAVEAAYSWDFPDK